jgi:peptide/nickel transport system permease protein
MLFVATLSFALIHAAPGDPFSSITDNVNVNDAARNRMRREFGLDRPLPEQYVRWLGNLARGELGYSFNYQRPVVDVLKDALPNTLVLMGTALTASFLIGMALGIVQATRRGGLADHVVGTGAMIFGSFPDFWLAIILMLTFAYWLPIFPVAGMVNVVTHDYLSAWGRFMDVVKHLVLPASALTLVIAAPIARFQRAALLDVLPEEYLRTARAKGLSEREVVLRHALRNALGPIITLLGLGLPLVLGGAVFVEGVFAWPGIGSVAIQALSARDYPMVLANVLVGSLLVVVGSILADVLYGIADPRLRVER